MDKKIVQQVILETLDAVNDQVKMITEYNGKIPWIEIDITKDYLRTLYENVLVLERYNGVDSDFDEAEVKETGAEKPEPSEVFFQPLDDNAEENEVVTEKPVEEQPVEKPEKEPEDTETKAETVEENEPEEIKDEQQEKPQIIVEEKEKINDNTPQKETKQPEPEPLNVDKPEENKTEQQSLPNEKPVEEKPQKAADKTPTVGDSFVGEKKSLGEVIQKDEGSLNENMGKKPIRKLKSAIGINDKFFFVNELFNGVLGDYNEAITSLDNAVGREAAVEILGILQKKHQWDTEGDGYKKLEDFVNRKF